MMNKMLYEAVKYVNTHDLSMKMNGIMLGWLNADPIK